MLLQFEAHDARVAASLLFWGTLILLLDLWIDGVDIINDVVGAILVLVGVVRLAGAARRLPTRAADVALPLAVIVVPLTLVNQFEVSPALLAISGIASYAGVLLVALAFEHVAMASDDGSLARSWRTSRWLIGVLGGLAIVTSVVALVADGPSRHYETAWAIPLVLLALAPLVHLLVILRRTRWLQPPVVGSVGTAPGSQIAG